MRWVRFRGAGGPRQGVIEGDHVLEIEGSPFSTLRRTGVVHNLADLTLLPPVIPPTFYAAGLNYKAHFAEVGEQRAASGYKLPTKPDIGYRAITGLTGPGMPVVMPSDSPGPLQFEGELVAVIGRKARNLSHADALSCVFGYTIGNDVSQRTWQRGDRTSWRAKNAATFSPMGPWIETDLDLDSLLTTVRLNGRIVSHFRTNDMIFGVADYISAMSRYLTLYPGDVIWMGTEEPTLDMVVGDTVDVEISGIGVLSNTIVAEADAGDILLNDDIL